MRRHEDSESEELLERLQTYSPFGEVSFLCNTPQPYSVRASQLCRVLRLDKQSFREILDIHFLDGRIILNNLLEVNRLENFRGLFLLSCFFHKKIVLMPRQFAMKI